MCHQTRPKNAAEGPEQYKVITEGVFKNIPVAHIGVLPTPLEPLPRLGSTTGHRNLWVKRDDVTGLGLGGNKTRSLRFLLGEALHLGCDTVVTAGAPESNLCSLTAAACCKTGLDCVLVHNSDPPPKTEGNMLLNKIFGAQQVFAGNISEEKRTGVVKTVERDLERRGKHPYVVHNGASTPVGALGYLEAAIELKNQSRCMGIDIKHVFIVGAMGGTASGFVYGTALLGAPFHVHVISVEYPENDLRSLMGSLFDGISVLLADRNKTACRIPPEEVMTLTDNYLGDGYARPTKASRDTLSRAARQEGLLVEDVYTSKTLAGTLDMLKSGVVPAGEAACFIHTGGSAALFAQKLLM